MIQLAHRMSRIQPSPTLAITAKAAQLQREGKNVIGLGAGEPDFDTPQHIKDAAIAAINAGFTKYTAVDGIPDLKAAIVSKLARENNLTYKPSQVIVSVGGKQACYNLCQALLNEGDEVIIPAPYWVSYPAFAELADAKPVFINAGIKQRFKITPAQLAAAITPKTRLLFLNSPSNPSGINYTKAELMALAEVLLDHPRVMIGTDDMYEHILWSDEPFANILNACPALYDRTIILNGVSKAYSMTGWRIGYAAGPEPIINAMKNLQSQSTSNPCCIAQKAAVAALNGDQSCIQEMLTAFKRRHDFVVAGLNAMPGVECLEGDGTFYAFPHIEKAMHRLGFKNDVEFSDFLLEKAEVAVVPGSAFGLDGYIRISFATSDALLREALARMAAVIV